MKETKIVVEVKTIADAWELVSAGVDGIQFDKITATDLEVAVPKLKAINNNIMILAAGGINESNIIDYAATGVDVLVSSSPYNSKPADIGVKIEPCRVG